MTSLFQTLVTDNPFQTQPDLIRDVDGVAAGDGGGAVGARDCHGFTGGRVVVERRCRSRRDLQSEGICR